MFQVFIYNKDGNPTSDSTEHKYIDDGYRRYDAMKKKHPKRRIAFVDGKKEEVISFFNREL